MKKITLLFMAVFLLGGLHCLRAQTNLIPDAYAPTKSGTGAIDSQANKWGWASSSSGAIWGTLNGADVRYRDIVSLPISTGGTFTGREFLYRYDGVTTTYAESILALGLPTGGGPSTQPISGIPLVANNPYTLSGLFEWVNNGNNPSYTFRISTAPSGGTIIASFTTPVISVKNTYNPFSFSFVPPSNGNYFIQIVQPVGLTPSGGLVGLADFKLIAGGGGPYLSNLTASVGTLTFISGSPNQGTAEYYLQVPVGTTSVNLNATPSTTVTVTVDGTAAGNGTTIPITFNGVDKIATVVVTDTANSTSTTYKINMYSDYLFNESFDLIPTFDTNATGDLGTGVGGANVSQLPGWTRYTADPSAAATYQYGTAKTLGTNVPPTVDANGASTGASLGMLATALGAANPTTTYIAPLFYSQPLTLPAGSYKISCKAYNASSTTTGYASLLEFVPTSGTSTKSTRTTYAANTWTEDEIIFTLTATTTGTLKVGVNASILKTTANPRLFFDHLAITQVPSWDGTAWSNTTGPDATLEAVINGPYSTAVNGTINAKKLIVNTGASLTVDSGTGITIQNELINKNAGAAGATNVVVKNNANLYQVNPVANTGWVSVERNSTPMVRLDYTLWSTPVITPNLFTFSPLTTTSPTVRFYRYDTATDAYSNTGLSGTSTFSAGIGYAVRAPNDFTTTPAVFTGVFKGEPRNSNFTVALLTSGNAFNLIGNPYPSPINATTFVTANSSVIDGTLYFFSHNAKSDGTAYETSSGGTGMQYATWNGTGGTAAASGISGIGQNTAVPTGIIQIGQGFIVKASTAGNLSFTNTMRVSPATNTTNDPFFKFNTIGPKSTTAAIATEKHRLWLNLTNANGVGMSQLLVGYVDGATNEVDNLYDGEEFGNPTTSLTSQLNGKSYTIQGRALPFVDSDVVPLAFKAATDGTYSISLAQTDGVFASDQEVLLKDNATGTLTNLKTGAYTFTATAGKANARFELVYSKSGINGMAENGVRATAVKKQGVFQISTNGALLKDIAVYDVLGHEVLKQKNINSSVSTLTDLPSTKGVFIVKLTTETNQTQTIKIIN